MRHTWNIVVRFQRDSFANKGNSFELMTKPPKVSIDIIVHTVDDFAFLPYRLAE